MDAAPVEFLLPADVLFLLDRMNCAGFQAYAVGGCVRDLLAGQAPHDWDICTDAAPQQVAACLPDLPVIGTGLAHGTVTAVRNGAAYEITTFRTESGYSDGRRPDAVQFVHSLREDLARRDFTVNAMAYHPATGLADPFGGRADLTAGILRCVGDPNERFSEDHLRILRALRFAAAYRLRPKKATAAALHSSAPLLSLPASERIFAELRRLVCAPDAARVMAEYADVLFVYLPELLPMQGFQQENPYHDADVWQHTLRAVNACPPEETVRLAALFHDCGKPFCFTRDEQGAGHFYGHAAKSEQIARAVLHRLRAERALTENVCALISRHDMIPLPDGKFARNRLAKLGEAQYRRLICLWRADVCAQSAMCRAERLNVLDAVQAALDEALRQHICFSLKHLAVRGTDLIAAGIPAGPVLGEILQSLLRLVMADALPNDRDALLAAALAQYRSRTQE